MSKIAIFATNQDIHSFATERCLSLLGEDTALLFLEHVPGDVSAGTTFSGADDGHLHWNGTAIDLNRIKSSLCRRFPENHRFSSGTLEVDHKFVKRQSRSFSLGVLAVFDSFFAVNSLNSVFTNSNKINQLFLAKKCGLLIPRTLVSSDAAHVKEFFRGSNGCVKLLEPHTWKNEDSFYTTFTSKVEDFSAISDQSIQISPTIYQEYIEKKYEYRIAVFGGYHQCTRIDNQDGTEHAIDWRTSYEYFNQLSLVEPPTAVLQGCRMLMKSIGLRYGAFDFVEDKNGNWYFLEVNESGAFLWQELYCDGCRLIEPFSRFVASADDNFTWESSSFSTELSAQSLLSDSSLYPEFDSGYVADPNIVRSYHTTESAN